MLAHKAMTHVTVKSVVEELFDMEDDLRLFHQQIYGVNFWEFVRLFVFQRIREGMGLFVNRPRLPRLTHTASCDLCAT